jgi:uncharacterized protein YbaR (Trm112 family)
MTLLPFGRSTSGRRLNPALCSKFLMRNKIDVLVCPNCLGSLDNVKSALVCRKCERRFLVEDAIPCFAPTNLFYDTYAEEHCPYALSPAGLKGFVLRFLPFWSWREWRFWRLTIPDKTPCLLDLGCGRGRELFVSRARCRGEWPSGDGDRERNGQRRSRRVGRVALRGRSRGRANSRIPC